MPNPTDSALPGFLVTDSGAPVSRGPQTPFGHKPVYTYPDAGVTDVPIIHYLRIGMLEFRDRKSFQYNQGPVGYSPTNAEVNNKAAIYLPIPDNVASNVAPSWDLVDLDWMGFGLHQGDAIANLANAALSGSMDNVMAAGAAFQTEANGVGWILGRQILNEVARNLSMNEAADTVSVALRKAFNPFKEAVFRGVANRNFQFSWNLTPKSEKDCETIYNIIKLLKYHSVPEMTEATSMFEYPGEFTLEFYSDGVPNKYLPKIGFCVCNGVDTNFTATGVWAAYRNGHPIDISLTLTFTEVELVTKDKIVDGY